MTLTETEGLYLLLAFGVSMIALVWFKTDTERSAEGFLAADRQLPMWQGAFSIAISWVWAPALFICSMQAYTLGLPGIFWFTAPNIVCFFVFAPIAIRLRRLMPMGYTLPQFIHERFEGNKPIHLLFLAGFFLTMVAALVANAYAGGILLNQVSGVDVQTAIVSMFVIALAYSLISGLKASVFTDVIQMALVLGLAFIIVPWCLSEVEGFKTVSRGLVGIEGIHGNFMDPRIAWIMGVPMTIALITGPVADQMFFQRAMAVKFKDIVKTFVYGGLIFGLVPICLSLLGFIGVELANEGRIVVDNPEMIGPIVIGALLPKSALYAFVFMAFAGLCSTLDSAFCGISSLGGVDIYQRYFRPNAKDKRLLRASRFFMIGSAFAGLGIALLEPSMLWTFMITGSITAALFFPIAFALFWKKVTRQGVFWAVLLSLLIGIPYSIDANISDDVDKIAYAAIISVGIGLLVCLVSGFTNKNEGFDFDKLGNSS